MRNLNLVLFTLGVSFAVLMSVPFLIPHAGLVALVGFVPLLLMDAVADAHGVKRFFWWYYGAFVLWNAFATFWVCNATVGGGIFAVLANAAQMALIWALFRASKKHFNDILSYVFLAVMWIAWEKFYFSAEISWPWLVLGNSFARSIRCIQWYEYTGTLGGSMWILVSNIWLFLLLKSLMQGTFHSLNIPARAASAGLYVVLVAAPLFVSANLYRNCDESSETLDVVIAQPDFDPYEKFQSLSQNQQNVILLDLFEKGLKGYMPGGGPTLLLAPETFTSDIVVGRHESSPTWNRFHQFLQDYPDANLLFGASTFEHFQSEKSPSYTARKLKDGSWYESHNSALIMDGEGRTEIFHKSKLVVGVELTPYPAVFTKLDNLLGGVMGRCVGQDSVTVLHCKAGDIDIPIGSIVCYESVYGEYCTDYVKAGARALAVITNDAWWGDTPGYRQHLSYSCLRAVETRRDIARCANTGISAFIDNRGDIVSESQWWQAEVLSGSIHLNDRVTFFVSHGDMVGRVCTFMFILIMLSWMVRILTQKKREA